MERDELSGWLRLQCTPGIGAVSARRLLAAFGLPHTLFAQSRTALESVVGSAQAAALRSEPPGWATLLDRTVAWLASAPLQHRVIAIGDAHYPETLLQLEDPPLLLYGQGAQHAWRALPTVGKGAVAVVGSRNPTPQGLINARQFAKALAGDGCTIVSGLALGVDGAAHEGALEGARPDALATIAVVGTGLDRVYPRQHHALAHRIALQGLLLSEFALGTPPHPAHFPQRNRLIAALAEGTLVIEAALQSGSLITARLAAELGREVFAIPGSIHSTQSRGCHALIRQGAKLVECGNDILEELRPSDAMSSAMISGAFCAGPTGSAGLNASENALLEALGLDPCSLDALQARTGLETSWLQAQLMQQELLGQVTRLPGGLFQRLFQS